MPRYKTASNKLSELQRKSKKRAKKRTQEKRIATNALRFVSGNITTFPTDFDMEMIKKEFEARRKNPDFIENRENLDDET